MLLSLPQPFCEEKWLKEGTSTLLRWAVLQRYPWHLTDEELFDSLTKICRVLYGTTVSLSKQRLSGLLVKHARNYIHRYCESFGAAGLSAVNAYLKSHAMKKFKDSFVLQAHFAHDQLIAGRFLYGQSGGRDPAKWRGSFKGPLVIATLVHHFQQIDDARVVPELMSGLCRSLPRAALALSAAVIEHVLILQAKGNLNLPIYGEHSAQTDMILKSWRAVWQENTVPYLALVACLGNSDVTRACQIAFKTYKDSI